jgi:hypothetical protein
MDDETRELLSSIDRALSTAVERYHCMGWYDPDDDPDDDPDTAEIKENETAEAAEVENALTALRAYVAKRETSNE